MSVVTRVNELDVDANLVVSLLDAAFQDVSDSKLLRNLVDVSGGAFEPLGSGARNNFQLRNFCQPGQNLVLDAFAEVGVIGIFAEVLERKHGH